MAPQHSSEIERLLELLDTHRSTLHELLLQRAQFSAGYVPSHINNGINQTCREIAAVKNQLRTLGQSIEDLPSDFPPVVAPAKHQATQSFWSIFSRSEDKEYDPQREQRNRQALIRDMRLRYQERLNQVSKTIPLALAERPHAVNPPGTDPRPYDLALRQKNQADRLLPKESRLIDLFDGSNQQLLILGAPGSGKSFLLYELAHDLVERAAADSSTPVPVIFSLASWQSNQSLPEWMISDLSRRFNTKPQQIEPLFRAGSILPLLDGLDEVVTLERRQLCVTAINTYKKEHPLGTPLAVTCREREYRDLPELSLNTALVIQALAQAQINRYLASSSFAPLRQALAQDPSLADLASTPLFLSFMASSYRDHAPKLPAKANSDTVRQIVLNDYVTYCCGEPIDPKALKVPVTKLRAFLAWLASGMIAHNNQQDFYIEFLQPTWLPSKRSLWLWRSLIIIIAVVIAALGGGIFGGLTLGLIGVLFFGAIFGVVFGIDIKQDMIETPEIWRWSWRSTTTSLNITRNIKWGISKGIFFGLFGGTIGGVIFSSLRNSDIVLSLILATTIGLFIGLYLWIVIDLINILRARFISSLLTERQLPNQAIKRSYRSAVIGSMIGFLIGGLVFSIMNSFGNALVSIFIENTWKWSNGIFFGLSFGFTFGLIFGFFHFGGEAILKHYSLRLALALNTPAPYLLVPWLEEACRRGLLIHIGGAYRFRHELLQRHFAAYQEPGFPSTSFLAEKSSSKGLG